MNPLRLRDFSNSQIVLSTDESNISGNSIELKKKSLSLGIETDVTPKEIRKTRKDRPNTESHALYKSLLDNDRLVIPTESRKKYERKGFEPDGGLVIGDQSDAAELRIRKHLMEREHKKLLDADLATNITLKSFKKLIRDDVPSIMRDRLDHPETLDSASGFESTFRFRSVQDYLSSPVKVVPDKSRRANENRRDEEACSFFIGKDELELKSKSRALKEQFLKQLDTDSEYLKNSQTLSHRVRKSSSHDLYVDRTGWTGLNIGGSASNDAKTDRLVRSSMQREYAEFLAGQVRSRAERERDEKLRDSLIPAFESKVPYMSSE